MMDNLELFQATLDGIQPVDPRWIEHAEERQARLTKPPGSIGRFEEIANRPAAIQRTLSISVERPRIILFAADHGVCAEGVNPYPQAVTGQMVSNILRGGAAINAAARGGGTELRIADAGGACDVSDSGGRIRARVARGTEKVCKDRRE